MTKKLGLDERYQWVRHPGYVGFGLAIAAMPILLNSVWAFLPIAATLVTLLVRTSLEDRLLQRELPGFSDYAERVRYRLVPGLW